MDSSKKLKLTDMRAVLALACLCCFLWGSATPAIKTGYRLFQIQPGDTFSIIVFAGVRFLLAGFLVILYHSLQSRRWVMPPKGAGREIFNLSLAQTALQYFFFYVGLSHASGVHGAILTGTGVFISILLASLVFGYERLNGRKLVGCALGFAGIVIMNLSGNSAEGILSVSLLGEGFVMISQVFYAVSGALIKKYSQEYDVVTLSGYQFMLGGALLTAAGLLGGGSLAGADGGTVFMAVLAVLYLALVSAVAYTVWGVLLKHNPVSRVTVFGFMNPMFGVLLSAVFLGETGQALRWNTLAALVLVCAGIYVVNRPEKY